MAISVGFFGDNKNLINSMSQIITSVGKVGDALKGLGGNFVSSIAKDFNEASESAKNAANSTSMLSRAFGDFFQQYTAANLALEGFRKVTQAISQAGNTIVDFQQKNSMLGAILGESAESTADLTEQAIDLGRKTVFTASQVTQLQIELSKLGFEKKAIEDMTDSILAFAQATGGDLGDAASLTGAALRMFGAQTEEANRYTNAMARATTASALNFQTIRDNLATFGPMAHSLGLEIEDVLALFGTLKNAGIEGSTAMTSLRNIFTRMSQGKIAGLEGGVKTLDEFVSKIKQLGDLEPGKAMKQVGTRGGTQFLTLIQQADTILELRDKIKAASEEDTTAGMAEQMTDNVRGAIFRMQSAWEGFVLSFSDAVTGPWASVLETIAEGVNWVTDAIRNNTGVSIPAMHAMMGSMGSLIALYGVRNGVAAVTAALSKAEIEQYVAMATALDNSTRAESAYVDAELKEYVVSKKITQAQAERLSVILRNIDANIAAKKTELQNMETELAEIILTEKDTAAENMNTAATDRNTQAETRNEMAKRKEYLTQQIATRRKELDTAVTERQNLVTNMMTKSTNKLIAALRLLGLTNPYMWIAAAIGGVIFAISAYNESLATAEKAQIAVNNAMKDFNGREKESENKARDNIKVIQDTTASLYEQYTAYKELIAERKAFADYSQEEIKAMTEGEIKSILSNENVDRQEEALKKRIEMMKEYYEYAKDIPLWGWFYREEETFKEMGKKIGMSEEEIDAMLKDQHWLTNIEDWARLNLEEFERRLQELYADKARSGIIGGISNGLSDKTLQDTAYNIIDDILNEAVPTKNAQAVANSLKKELDEVERELSKKQGENITYDSETMGGDNIAERMKKLNEAKSQHRKEIEALDKRRKELQEEIAKVTAQSATADVKYADTVDGYKKKLGDSIREAKEKVRGMRDSLRGISDEKVKTQVQTEIKAAENDVELLKGLLSLLESGDKEAIARIRVEMDETQLDEDTKIDLGQRYEDANMAAERYLDKIEGAQEEMRLLGDVSEEEAKRIVEKWGLTAEDVEASFGKMEKEANAKINELDKELATTKDKGKKVEIEAKIKDYRELLSHIDGIKEKVNSVVKEPYKLTIKFDADIPNWLRGLLGMEQKDSQVTPQKHDWINVGTPFDNKNPWGGTPIMEGVENTNFKGGIFITNTDPAYVSGKQSAGKSQQRIEIGKQTQSVKDARENQNKQDQKDLTDKQRKEAERRAKEKADRDAKEKEQLMKQQDELEKIRREAEDAQTKAAIAAIQDQGMRERAEREYQHEKTMKDIERQEEDIWKKIYNNRKADYENKNKGKRYVNTEEGAKGWRGLMDANKQLEDVQAAQAKAIDAAANANAEVRAAIDEIRGNQFFNGNVDILARPFIQAADLVKKGWKDVGDGIASAYTKQSEFKDAQGHGRGILYTPVLENGEVLTPQALNEYLTEVLSKSSTTEDILANDTRGLIVGVDIELSEGDLGQKLQELYGTVYENIPEEEKERFKSVSDNVKKYTSLAKGELDLLDANRSKSNAKRQEEDAKYARQEQERRKKEVEDINNFFKQYGDYQEKMDAARAEGDKELEEVVSRRLVLEAELKKARESGNAEMAASLEEQIAMNDRQQLIVRQNTAKGLKKIEDEYSDFYRRLSKDRSQWLTGDIVSLLTDAEKKIAEISQDPSLNEEEKEERIARLKREIRGLKDELGSTFSVNGILRQLLAPDEEGEGKSFKERIKGIVDAWKNMTVDQKWSKIGAIMSSIANGMQKAAEYMRELAEISGDAGLADTAKEMESMAQNLNAAGQGAASGGWIGAIVGGVSDIMDQSIEAITNVALQEEIAAKNARDWASAIELVSLAVDESDFKSIFGTREISLASARYKEYTDSVELYAKKIKEINDAYNEGQVEEKTSIAPAAAIFFPVVGMPFAFAKETTNEYKTYMEAAEKGYNGLQRMLIKTKEQTGWGKFWGMQDEFTSLGDLAPELWDENGELIIDKAKKFLETNTQINDTQKEEIQNLIDIKEKYEEALQAVDDHITNTFGDLASDISDTIWDSVMNGSDAWSKFREIGSDVITSLGKELLQEMVITDYLEQYREDLREAYNGGSPEEVQKKTRDIMDEIVGGLDNVLYAGTSMAEEWKEWAEQKGYDLSQETQKAQEASGRSFQTMSQETGDELSGRFAALQISNEHIAEQTMQINLLLTSMNGSSQVLGVQITGMLTQMASLTAASAAGNGFLEEMRNMMLETNGYLSDILGNNKKIYSEFKDSLDKIYNKL